MSEDQQPSIKLHRVDRSSMHLLSFVQAFLRQHAPSVAHLFMDDYWAEVAWVALAWEKKPVGVAILAPWNSEGEGPPKIISVWVAPDYRRRRIGTHMVQLLCEQSRQQYGTYPCAVAVTYRGESFVNSWRTNSIQADFEILAPLTDFED